MGRAKKLPRGWGAFSTIFVSAARAPRLAARSEFFIGESRFIDDDCTQEIMFSRAMAIGRKVGWDHVECYFCSNIENFIGIPFDI